jgi:hypothetical protein
MNIQDSSWVNQNDVVLHLKVETYKKYQGSFCKLG